MNNFSKEYYFDNFYFSFIQFQYQFAKKVFADPEHCIYKDIGLPPEIIYGARLTPAIIEIALGLLPPAKFTTEIMNKADRFFFNSGACSFNKLALPVLENGDLPLPMAFAGMTACQEAARNFPILARKFNKECFMVDIPYQRSDEAVQYLAKQYQELMSFLCQISGQPFDIDYLRTIIRNSNTASQYFEAANELRKKSPALIYGGQMLKFINIRMFFGAEEVIPIAKEFYDICRERYENNQTPVREKFRILWSNMGLMYDNYFFEYLEKELGAIIAFEEFNYSAWEPMDERDPFMSLARKTLDTHFIGDVQRRIDYLLKFAREFQIDGIISFSHMNCRMFNTKFFLIKEALDRQSIPILELSGDSMDKRSYSRAQLTTRLDAFIEMLNQKKYVTN